MNILCVCCSQVESVFSPRILRPDVNNIIIYSSLRWHLKSPYSVAGCSNQHNKTCACAAAPGRSSREHGKESRSLIGFPCVATLWAACLSALFLAWRLGFQRGRAPTCCSTWGGQLFDSAAVLRNIIYIPGNSAPHWPLWLSHAPSLLSPQFVISLSLFCMRSEPSPAVCWCHGSNRRRLKCLDTLIILFIIVSNCLPENFLFVPQHVWLHQRHSKKMEKILILTLEVLHLAETSPVLTRTEQRSIAGRCWRRHQHKLSLET